MILFSEHEWDHQYILRFSMIPLSYIPTRVAESILFVGKAAHVLQKTDSLTKNGNLLPVKAMKDFHSSVEKLKLANEFHLLSV